MSATSWSTIVTAALAQPDGPPLQRMIDYMMDCERGKEILVVKGYGTPGMTVAAIAALVPAERGE